MTKKTRKVEPLRVETVALDQLHLDPSNARRHGARNLTAIQASLTRFGQQKPIVIGPGGTVVAGNGTLEAAQALGWTEIAVVRSSLSGMDRSAFAIADNRSAELAAWNDEILAHLLDPLDPSLLEATGFTEDELDELLRKLEQETDGANLAGGPDAELDRADELQKKWGTEPGQLWQIGAHRLFCGDATSAEAWARLMGDERDEIAWTDPPWNVAYGKAAHPSWKRRAIANDDLGAAFPEFARAFAERIARHLVPGAALYLAMSAQEWPTIHRVLVEAGFHGSSTILWAKDRLVLSRKDYHTQYEPIWYGWKEPGPRIAPLRDRTQSDLWEIPRPATSEEHPTMKPVELVRRSLRNSSRPGGLVLEPFAGSGTTLVAAEQTGRVARAIELEPRYVAVILERMARMAREGSGDGAEVSSGRP